MPKPRSGLWPELQFRSVAPGHAGVLVRLSSRRRAPVFAVTYETPLSLSRPLVCTRVSLLTLPASGSPLAN